ncbi:MAG: altered inheritance of mitochondria protein 21 [Paenibacillus sp.]|nr:altered inheritance of mitochondria protein 21 [Paenibacillus sp.]
MYRVRKSGWVLLGIIMLLLVACNGTPNAASEPTGQATEQPQVTEATAEPQVTVEPQPQVTVEPAKTVEPQETEEAPVEGQPPTALESARTVISALKAGNMGTLASWVHPEKGVRFSPYGYVDTKKDLVFSRDEVEGLMEDSKEYEWRTFPGSGELIKMPYAEYHKEFVYDADFIGVAKVSLNKGLGQGTTINNLNEVYPKENYDFVEYHIEGIDPSVEGMDWSSLRLVFEKMGQDHALVGIIHDQWTP